MSSAGDTKKKPAGTMGTARGALMACGLDTNLLSPFS